MREAIVPAFNEEATVASVVGVLLRSGCFDRVLVVDDGSKDATAALARQAGADVYSQPNAGKAMAMLQGCLLTTADPIAFFDADLLGFEPWHVQRLASLADLGYDMVCGLREYDLLGNPLQMIGPLITGERFVARRLLSAVTDSCWDGYDIETAMNYACKQIGARTVMTPLRGLRIRGKVKKGGVLGGLKAHYKMFNRIATADRTLENCGECRLPRRLESSGEGQAGAWGDG